MSEKHLQIHESAKSEKDIPTITVDFSKPPPIYILADHYGKVTALNPNDVLCGRGGAISNYSGNTHLRTCVAEQKGEYLRCIKKIEKACICAELVAKIRSLNPPGRFLEKDETEKCWREIGDERARIKVGQALREPGSGRRKKRGMKNQSGSERSIEIVYPPDMFENMPVATAGSTQLETLSSSLPQHAPHTTSTITSHSGKRTRRPPICFDFQPPRGATHLVVNPSSNYKSDQHVTSDRSRGSLLENRSSPPRTGVDFSIMTRATQPVSCDPYGITSFSANTRSMTNFEQPIIAPIPSSFNLTYQSLSGQSTKNTCDENKGLHLSSDLCLPDLRMTEDRNDTESSSDSLNPSSNDSESSSDSSVSSCSGLSLALSDSGTRGISPFTIASDIFDSEVHSLL